MGSSSKCKNLQKKERLNDMRVTELSVLGECYLIKPFWLLKSTKIWRIHCFSLTFYAWH